MALSSWAADLANSEAAAVHDIPANGNPETLKNRFIDSKIPAGS